MRILMLTSSYPRNHGDWRGGFVRDLARRFAMGGHQVEVAVPRGDDVEDESADDLSEHDEFEPRVFRLPGILPAKSDVFAGYGIEAALREKPWRLLSMPPFMMAFAVEASVRAMFADVIVAHWLVPMGVVGSWVARITGKPFGIVAHSGTPAMARIPPMSVVLRRTIKGAASVACVSDSVRNSVVGFIPAAEKKVETLHLGVEPMPFAASARGCGLRLLFVGRLVPIKGVDVLLKAMRRLDGVTLTVAGDGPEMGRLRGMARDYDLDVEFLGEVPAYEVSSLMDRVDAVAIVSTKGAFGREEGLPRVLIEAWAKGLPAIVSETGGIVDVVRRHNAAIMVPPGNSQAIRKAIMRLRDEPELRLGLHMDALSAMEHFSWSTLSGRWLDWVAGLVSAGR